MQYNKNLLRNLINFYLKGDEKQFISVTKFGAAWTDFKNKLKTAFDKASLKLDVSFLLHNCFCNVDNLES